jgi:glucosylglycerate synthase
MATANPISDDTSTAERASADLLVLATAMPPEQFDGVLAHLAEAFSAERVIVATQDELAAHASTTLRIVPVPRSGATLTLNPIDFINAYEIGREHEVRAVLLLGPGSDSLSPLALRTLADAVLNAVCDLVVPDYTLGPNTGLINSAILYPLTRALFAARARFPLALDLGFSMRMSERLANASRRFNAPNQDDALVWPVNEAIAAGFSVDEIDAGPRAVPQPADVDISAILARVTGSLFSDIEAKAAVWQRPRRPPAMRRPSASTSPAGSADDVSQMVEAFRLAYANLQEIWSLVLPPHSLLFLKRFSTVEASAFRIPDNLWARIVFDFLIAYRQRTINRGHLMGALIPLYLAWVASHINVTASGTAPERHIEAVAAAFEADKPYLVARWRWPDRFNA